jgi:hypothetical protein
MYPSTTIKKIKIKKRIANSIEDGNLQLCQIVPKRKERKEGRKVKKRNSERKGT